MAAGSNDNSAAVWSINTHTPSLLCRLNHSLAVKGILFCPWCPDVLATGAGSRDQNLRIWHVQSGCLLHQYNCHAQITSVIWLRYEKLLAVSFARSHPSCANPAILSVFRYPSMETLYRIPGNSLRALSATVDSSQGKIALHTHDGMIRTYSLWPNRHRPLTPALCAPGDLGSSILEHLLDVSRL